MKNTKIVFKKITKAIFNKAVVITLLSALSFAIPALVHGLIIRKRFDVTHDQDSLVTIGFSLVVIVINLVIAKKWLSLKEVGLQKSGLIKSLAFSLVFVALLRVLDYLGYKEIINKNVPWDRSFFLYLSTFVFLAFQEELMFRGVIFKVWEKHKGFLIALFISSVLFGLEHLLYPAMGFTRITTDRAVTSALFGPVLVLIAFRTKNIWGVTLSHFLYNASFLAAEPVIGNIEPIYTFTIVSAGFSIFLPILVDFTNRKIFKAEGLQIVWSKYLAGVFSIFFIIIVAICIFDDLGLSKDNTQFCPYLDNEKARNCINENAERVGGCHGIDLRLDKASEKVGGNKKALEVLKDNCLWLLKAEIRDLTGDGEKEIAMVTAGAGCGSCHYQKIYIIKGDEIIFQKDAEDVWFRPAEDYPGFVIKYPLRKQGEALCCPTESIVESYTISKINSDYKTFYKFDEHYERY